LILPELDGQSDLNLAEFLIGVGVCVTVGILVPVVVQVLFESIRIEIVASYFFEIRFDFAFVEILTPVDVNDLEKFSRAEVEQSFSAIRYGFEFVVIQCA